MWKRSTVSRPYDEGNGYGYDEGVGLGVRVKGVGVDLGGLVQILTLIRAGSMASLTVGPASSGS